MKRFFLLATLALLLAPAVQAQALPEGFDETFAITSMNPLWLLSDAQDAVIRLEYQRFDVYNGRKARLKVRKAVTVLNVDGQEFGVLAVGHDQFRKLKKLEGRLRDASGEVVQRLKRDDQEDYSAISGISLYEDNRVRVANLVHNEYPYTVEYEYEVEYDGYLAWPSWYPQRKDTPIQFAQFEVAARKGVPVRYALEGTEEPAIIEEEARTTYRWVVENQERFEREPWGPTWSQQAPTIYLAPTRFEMEGKPGSMESWASFGQWYHGLSENRQQLSAATQARYDSLLADAVDDREKARRLYQDMQDRTRYVSVQLGIGGWQPFEASYVEERSYGDCKALTNYMLAALKYAEIEAYPALISSGRGRAEVPVDFPCIPFNHVILYLPEADLWLENTSQTIPFGHIGASNEDRYALVVKPEGGELIRTPVSTAQDNRQIRHAHVTLNLKGDAVVDMTTTYTGNQQDHIRTALSEISGHDREQWLRHYLDLPNYEVSSVSFEDAGNRERSITLPLELTVNKYAARTGKRMFLKPNLLERMESVPPAMDEPRTQPIVPFHYPYADSDTITYTLPRGFRLEAAPETVELSHDFGYYKAETRICEDGTITYIRQLEIRQRRIPAEAYDDFRAFLLAVSKADDAQVVLVRGR